MKQVSAGKKQASDSMTETIKVFEDHIYKALESKFRNKSNESLFETVANISDYIMRKISALIKHPQKLKRAEDKLVEDKISNLDWLKPRHLSLPDPERTAN